LLMTESRKGTKNERRIDAMRAEKARVEQRLISLSIAMMRSDAALEAYHRERANIAKSTLSEDDLIQLDREMLRLENSAFTLARAHLTIWFAMLYVVIEGWRKWNFFDSRVDPLLTSQHLAELKAHRHAIFHAENFDAPAVMQFVASPERSKWVVDISNTLRQAIRDWNAHLPHRLTEYLARSAL